MKIELNKIYCDDCISFMKNIDDNTIDCIITSIPYNFDKPYDEYNDKVDYTEYTNWLDSVFFECSRILKDSGRIFVNCMPVYSDNFPTHHIVASLLMKNGLSFGNEIIWEKNNYNCVYTAWGSYMSPSCAYLKSTFEYVEYFYKNNKKHIGNKEDIDITADEFKKWTTAKWTIAPETKMKEYDHPAMFPEELVERILKLFTYKNDVVYDPFCGAGTTCAMCEKFGRQYIGTDISQKYCETARIRCYKEHNLKENPLW